MVTQPVSSVSGWALGTRTELILPSGWGHCARHSWSGSDWDFLSPYWAWSSSPSLDTELRPWQLPQPICRSLLLSYYLGSSHKSERPCTTTSPPIRLLVSVLMPTDVPPHWRLSHNLPWICQQFELLILKKNLKKKYANPHTKSELFFFWVIKGVSKSWRYMSYSWE